MALTLPALTAYLDGADVADDFATTRAAVDVFLATSEEPTASLPIPSSLAAAAGSLADLRALLWMLACGVNDDTVALGARCYMGDVSGTPTLLVRRVS